MHHKILIYCLLTLVCGAQLFGASFEENLAQILSQTGHKVKIIASKPLVGMNDMRIVNVEFSNATGSQRTPFLATADGKGAVIFNALFFSANKEQNEAIIESMLSEIDAFNQSKKNALLNALFESFPSERFVEIPSKNKNATQTTIIVSSPDCPYCREELAKLDKRLATSNVKMVIVPLNGQESYVRAQILINELQKANTTARKIEILKKIYAPSYQIPEKQKTIDTSFVAQNAEMVFKSGLIRSVPYIHIVGQ